MLTILRIKNLALVEDLTLEFAPGYNAITGETGAGKSILIGALNLALGERADRSLIRSGTDGCTVEATFDLGPNPSINAFLHDNGLEPCEHHQLILKRTLTTTGVNRQFINGSPATLNSLSALGQWLVDIHGPHDHQSLLRPAQQLDLLDAFAKLDPVRLTFSDSFRQLTKLDAEKSSLVLDESSHNRRLELLRFQVNEIDAARISPDEEQELQNEFHRVSNATRILNLGQTGLHQLSHDDNSILQAMGSLGRTLLDLQRIDPQTEPFASTHQNALTLLHDLKSDLDHYLDRIPVDPDRLQQLEERINTLQSLKRKYGHTLAEVLQFGAAATTELHSLENRKSELAQLDQHRLSLMSDLRRLGHQLTEGRRRAIPLLEKQVSLHLSQLGFLRSHFTITIHSTSPDTSILAPPFSSGFDQVEFQFAPNPGEPPRPLRAIASSGEMARVMLALKTVLAAQDAVPVLVFDEVDANIGGETAQSVGQKMREIGQHRQVLCITHLAPVAAFATTHYSVIKNTDQHRTTTHISRLQDSTRVDELARMLGGPRPAAKAHAQILLAHAQAYPKDINNPPRRPRRK